MSQTARGGAPAASRQMAQVRRYGKGADGRRPNAEKPARRRRAGRDRAADGFRPSRGSDVG